MSDRNGFMPHGELASIPGGQLRKDAAAAWNAMCDEALRRGLPVPKPDGPLSSYRTFAQQVALRNEWCAKGQCANAALPGTSNHGLGIAVDCSHALLTAHRTTVDQIGGTYGWGSKGSDAPWEEWHMKWQIGVWQRVVNAFLPLQFGSARNSGFWVYVLSGRLKNIGYLKARTSKYSRELETAVMRFQKDHHLKVDGITGQFTWVAVKAAERKARGR